VQQQRADGGEQPASPMAMYTTVLPASFYDRDPATVARELLGKLLVRELAGRMLVGSIVETEAYLAANDPASHAYSGRTVRNAAMFGPPGHAYVYLIYGRYYCVNVVTEGEGVPSAVLIRAVEPLVGIDIMQTRRGTSRLTNLASGPSRLCQAFAIDRTLDTWDMTRGQRLWCALPAWNPPLDMAVSIRVGISSARELPLRFYITTNQFVSRGPH
jgi:DNA-3-methyladenine glycosylase